MDPHATGRLDPVDECRTDRQRGRSGVINARLDFALPVAGLVRALVLRNPACLAEYQIIAVHACQNPFPFAFAAWHAWSCHARLRLEPDPELTWVARGYFFTNPTQL